MTGAGWLCYVEGLLAKHQGLEVGIPTYTKCGTAINCQVLLAPAVGFTHLCTNSGGMLDFPVLLLLYSLMLFKKEDFEK